MPNGMTSEQMLERLYTETVGMDGHGGIKGDVKNIKNEVDVIQKEMMTKTECREIRNNLGERKDKFLMRLKDVLLILIAIASILWGSGILSRGP